jgi:hypothetical protein
VDVIALASRGHDAMLIHDYLNGWIRDGALTMQRSIVAGGELDRSVDLP